jgi:hypothetical protein
VSTACSLPAPPRKQTSARQDQTGQTSTGDRAGDGDGNGNGNGNAGYCKSILPNNLVTVIDAVENGPISRWTINRRDAALVLALLVAKAFGVAV